MLPGYYRRRESRARQFASARDIELLKISFLAPYERKTYVPSVWSMVIIDNGNPVFVVADITGRC